MSKKPKVLFISNSHPDLYLGGAEVYAYELYKAMKASDGFEPIFLARSVSSAHSFRDQTPFSAVNDDANQILWYQPNHDYFFMACREKEQLTVDFDRLLRAYSPDIVHIQHTFGLGVDLIRQIKNSLPGTPIVYTLHEFLPICSAGGHMKKTHGGELCYQASPRSCHECFKHSPPHSFFLREHFVRSHFRLVDLFLSPSEFLRQRFIDWGIPEDKIRFMENGRILQTPEPSDHEVPLGNIGFFGQMMPEKGLGVLLEAMEKLHDSKDKHIHLYVNGANLSKQTKEFQELVSKHEDAPNVSFMGKYEPAELPTRMQNISWVVIPSIWWENSPLVIQEAWMHSRPIVCSDIGGMAEKVDHGVNGLHFRVNSSEDLAATLRRATGSAKLWKSLKRGIPDVYSIDDAVTAHSEIYSNLLRRAS